jgi:hypothetical protein
MFCASLFPVLLEFVEDARIFPLEFRTLCRVPVRLLARTVPLAPLTVAAHGLDAAAAGTALLPELTVHGRTPSKLGLAEM